MIIASNFTKTAYVGFNFEFLMIAVAGTFLAFFVLICRVFAQHPFSGSFPTVWGNCPSDRCSFDLL